MQIKTCLKPGQKGTKRWCERFGDRLLSVRYRYDAAKKRRYTTFEIIVEEGPWKPEPGKSITGYRATDRLGIRLEPYELAVGKWLNGLVRFGAHAGNYGSCPSCR